MLPIACWSTQAFLPGCEPVLSWSYLLPYCVLLSPVISWAHGGVVVAPGDSMSCLTLHPVPSDARAELASIVRKPSVYAGKNDPPPFTMRLCPAFVNGKTAICSVFGLFLHDFS